MKRMKRMKNEKDCSPYFPFLSFIRFMSSCWNLLPSAGPTVIDRRYSSYVAAPSSGSLSTLRKRFIAGDRTRPDL
jgi:hypothetical protein